MKQDGHPCVAPQCNGPAYHGRRGALELVSLVMTPRRTPDGCAREKSAGRFILVSRLFSDLRTARSSATGCAKRELYVMRAQGRGTEHGKLTESIAEILLEAFFYHRAGQGRVYGNREEAQGLCEV